MHPVDFPDWVFSEAIEMTSTLDFVCHCQFLFCFSFFHMNNFYFVEDRTKFSHQEQLNLFEIILLHKDSFSSSLNDWTKSANWIRILPFSNKIAILCIESICFWRYERDSEKLFAKRIIIYLFQCSFDSSWRIKHP